MKCLHYSFMHTDTYVMSEGVCRGGNSPENNAWEENFRQDLNCKQRCDISATCTGYALPSSENRCTTYTSVGATGKNVHGWRCYMKIPRMFLNTSLHVQIIAVLILV